MFACWLVRISGKRNFYSWTHNEDYEQGEKEYENYGMYWFIMPH